jgi:hypothetical protein
MANPGKIMSFRENRVSTNYNNYNSHSDKDSDRKSQSITSQLNGTTAANAAFRIVMSGWKSSISQVSLESGII